MCKTRPLETTRKNVSGDLRIRMQTFLSLLGQAVREFLLALLSSRRPITALCFEEISFRKQNTLIASESSGFIRTIQRNEDTGYGTPNTESSDNARR
uniref:Uncharacterized protein n=1 Tax=Vespula pensylvanica TaxID=30213 RepID=A0A834K5P5_VESPE|nr:hypothetical protein H0235_015634 [Vespula pensylvanica]